MRGNSTAAAPLLRLGMACAMLGGVVVACGHRRSEIGTIDLAQTLPAAEIRTEIELVDLGTPLARRHLGDGWSTDERRASDLDFVWALGRSASFELFVVEPRDLRMRLRCRPYHFSGGPSQKVEVLVGGGVSIGFALEPGWREYEIELPAASLRPGSNWIEFVAAHSWVPSERVGSNDDRPLAVAWDWIRFPDVSKEGRPAADAGGELRLPRGSETAWFLPPGESAKLVANLAAGRESSGVLELWWATDPEPGRLLATIAPGRGRFDVSLPDHPGPARLALRAVGGEVVLRLAKVEPTAAGELRADPRRAEAKQTPDRRPHVLLYSVDTLRFDRLGCYGSRRDLSPRLDRWAASATVFAAARSPTSWTKPAVATVLTGLGTLSHGLNLSEQRLA
ncbi:MAG: sulfatase-like hydrolase/transferase [Thermoanaerobaculales bacterium]